MITAGAALSVLDLKTDPKDSVALGACLRGETPHAWTGVGVPSQPATATSDEMFNQLQFLRLYTFIESNGNHCEDRAYNLGEACMLGTFRTLGDIECISG